MFKFQHILFWSLVVLIGALAAYLVNPYSYSLTNIDWLLDGDAAQSLIGWEFYRVSPQTFPITKIINILPETNFLILQSDTIPWLSVLCKLVLNTLGIKEPIHFIGFWLVLCWIIQGIYGALFAKLLKLRLDTTFFLVFLFVFSPVLMFRFGHFSLMGQWIILAAIYEAFRVILGFSLTLPRVFGLTTLVAFSLGVHPYLFAITAPIVTLVLLFNSTTIKNKIAAFSFFFAITGLSHKLLGFSTVKEMRADDFGACSADLLGVFNPFGSSLFIPALRSGWCQYEGYAYLGLGFLLMLFFVRKPLLSGIKWAWRTRPAKYFLILGILYIVYSLASPIRFGGNPILYIPFYSWIEPLPSIFRASGRWIWPLYYVIMIAGIYILDRTALKHKSLIVICLAIIHLVEFIPLYHINKPNQESSDVLQSIMSRIPEPTPSNKEMHIFPRVVSAFCGIADKKWEFREWSLIMIALARKGWHVDSGMGARISQVEIEKCKSDNESTTSDFRPLITKPRAQKNFIHNTNAKILMPGIYLLERDIKP